MDSGAPGNNESSTVSGSSFVRLKYREAPILPKLDSVRENVTISKTKKVKPVEEDPYADIAPIRIVPPVYFPGHTQITRKEKTIFSNETDFRKDERPNMYERMELEVQHEKKKKQVEKARAKREQMKKALEGILTNQDLLSLHPWYFLSLFASFHIF